MEENKTTVELTEEEISKLYQEYMKKLIESLNSVKDVSQDDILESLQNDEEISRILLSRKYVFYDNKIYPFDSTFISASLIPADVSKEVLRKSLLRLDGNYKVVYETDRSEQLKLKIKQFKDELIYVLLFPVRLIGDLFSWLEKVFFEELDVHITVAVHHTRESIYKIRSGEEKEINCDDLDVKALLAQYLAFDAELQSIPSSFSEALGYHMSQRKMSGAQLSSITGIAESTISKWLNENKKEVSSHKLKSMVSICIALHLPPVMSYNLIDLAGCRLLNNKKDRIYTMLLNYFYDKDLDYCDQVLEELGVKGLKIY